MESCPKPGNCKISLLCVLAIVVLRVYQILVSPMLRWRGVTCLHYPTCSNYALLAFRKYGFRKACRLSISRWRDCHPFSGRSYLDYP
jgi:putative membrane protein insertion efficiency factor